MMMMKTEVVETDQHWIYFWGQAGQREGGGGKSESISRNPPLMMQRAAGEANGDLQWISKIQSNAHAVSAIA